MGWGHSAGSWCHVLAVLRCPSGSMSWCFSPGITSSFLLPLSLKGIHPQRWAQLGLTALQEGHQSGTVTTARGCSEAEGTGSLFPSCSVALDTLLSTRRCGRAKSSPSLRRHQHHQGHKGPGWLCSVGFVSSISIT